MRNVEIVKADGTREVFRPEKLIHSLERAGADAATISHIVDTIESTLKPGMTTKEIYRSAFAILRKKSKPSASRYSLKHALLDLGPTGFPFEDFIAEIFRGRGFQVETRKMVEGKCITHEIDVVAKNNTECHGIEAKFHNRAGERSDAKVALYVGARFSDIFEGAMEKGKPCPISQGWLITNTKFTRNAIDYGLCRGINLVGWSYPQKGNLQDLIEEAKVHPLTCLTTLSGAEKRKLLEGGIVLCKNIKDDVSLLSSFGLGKHKIESVKEEARILCT